VNILSRPPCCSWNIRRSNEVHLKKASYGLILVLATINTAQAASAPSVNVSYSGNLVAEPCTLLPEDESIAVNFGSVIDKYLYLNTRTLSKPFQLRLMDCDTTLGNTVKVTFSGTESISLPVLLAPASGSEASGIAIGLETQDGVALALNKQSRGQDITDGNNVIFLQAYVMAEPDALSERKIKKGDFSAVANFNIAYE